MLIYRPPVCLLGVMERLKGGVRSSPLHLKEQMPAAKTGGVSLVPCMDGARGAREKNLTFCETFGCCHVCAVMYPAFERRRLAVALM